MKAALTLLAVLALTTPANPCSAFVVTGDGRVLFANNEDYLDPDTYAWFVPAKDGRHGAMYLGYSNGFPQGGMNDAGLAFDGFATDPHPMTQQDGKEAYASNTSLLADVMETCATVDEVVAFFERIDLRPILTHAMLFYADASGAAVIVEGDEIIRKTGDVQAITNFYQSECEDPMKACPRYAAAMKVLEKREKNTPELCKDALSAAAQRGRSVATLYSNVFDLEARTARLYLFHDYEHPVELELDEELAKGARTLELPELFPRNADFERFVENGKKSVEQQIRERKGPKPSKSALQALEGDYDLAVNGKTHRITLRRDGDDLMAESAIYSRMGGKCRYHSASDTEYFFLSKNDEQTLRFRLGEDGRATGFMLEQNDVGYEAVRVKPD